MSKKGEHLPLLIEIMTFKQSFYKLFLYGFAVLP